MTRILQHSECFFLGFFAGWKRYCMARRTSSTTFNNCHADVTLFPPFTVELRVIDLFRSAPFAFLPRGSNARSIQVIPFVACMYFHFRCSHEKNNWSRNEKGTDISGLFVYIFPNLSPAQSPDFRIRFLCFEHVELLHYSNTCLEAILSYHASRRIIRFSLATRELCATNES